MDRYEEHVFEKKAEQEFKGQRELPNGRDFNWNNYRFIDREARKNYRENIARIFPNSPGADI